MLKQQESNSQTKGTIIAIVGMPGAGKTEAASYLQKKGIPFLRFGDFTEETLKKLGKEVTPENERMIREKLRAELGMAAYAKNAKPKIISILKNNDVIVLDGLYSWEEYIYLKKYFPQLLLIHIYAEPVIRYKRLKIRKTRPLVAGKARIRDVSELEGLNKGGPIAIADFMIENNDNDLTKLHEKIETILNRIGI